MKEVNKNIGQGIWAAGICLLISACQTMPYQGEARDVKRKPKEGGVIAMKLNFRDEDRKKAEEKMASNCGTVPYKIMEEGEVAIGQETKSNSRDTKRDNSEKQVGSLLGIALMSGDKGGKDTESSSVVTSVKEWQIAYECEKGNAPATRKH